MRRWAAVLVAATACGGAPPRPVELAPRPPVVLPTPLGALVAVATVPGATILVGATAAAVIRGGVVVATTALPDGATAATTIAAPDGDGRWALILGGDGHLRRLATSGELRDVSAQLGLDDAAARGLAGAGATLGVATADGVATTADGHQLRRIATAAPRAIAAAPGIVAILTGDLVTRWDLGRARQVTYPIRGAQAIALLDDGRLAVAATSGLYLSDGAELRRLELPAAPTALAAAGARLWVRAGDELYVVDGATARDAGHAATATALVASADGELWRDRGDRVEHFAVDPRAPEAIWQATVAPVFQRACAGCHLPDGDGGLDLSTADAWDDHRAVIRRQVIVKQAMPPAGSPLSAGDRAALARWLR